jgi:hypothetical protein
MPKGDMCYYKREILKPSLREGGWLSSLCLYTSSCNVMTSVA